MVGGWENPRKIERPSRAGGTTSVRAIDRGKENEPAQCGVEDGRPGKLGNEMNKIVWLFSQKVE